MKVAMVVVTAAVTAAGFGLAGCEAGGAKGQGDLLTRTMDGAYQPHIEAAGGTPPATVATAAETRHDLLGIEMDADDIRHQRALTLFRMAMDNAEKALAEGEWEKAARFANEASAVVDENRAHLWQTESTELRGRSAAMLRAAERRARVAEGAREEIEAPAKAKSPEEMRREIWAAAQRRQVQTLREDAAKFAEQRRYIEAIDALKALLAIEPTDNAARRELRDLEDRLGMRQYDRLREMQSKEQSKLGVEGKELLIPYSDVVTYPEDWVEKTRGRK